MEDFEKKYNDALERANAKIETYNRLGNASVVKSICDIFPELKESEDERIRKEIVEYIKIQQRVIKDEGHIQQANDIEEWLVWLEKKCEQKAVSKTEPIVEGLTTEFQKHVSHLIASAMDKEHEYTKSYIEWVAQSLLGYAKNEQTPTNKVEPKFKVGDTIRPKGSMAEYTIESISGECYHGKGWGLSIDCDEDYELVEQKTADKVEPKFHAGDFITDGERIFQIEETIWERNNRNDGTTYCESLIVNLRDGITYANNTDLKEYHLWTIQDVKEGDVLSFNDGHGNDCIELIKSIIDKKIEFWFCLTNGNYCEVFDGVIPYTNLVSREDATPATKEQRDLLFQKMHEAGYEWDSEKKELKKIEQKPTGKVEPKFKVKYAGREYNVLDVINSAGVTFCGLEDEPNHISYVIADNCEIISGGYGIKEDGFSIPTKSAMFSEQKPTWSEEDERNLKKAIECCTNRDFVFQTVEEQLSFLVWLKSLKERMKEG